MRKILVPVIALVLIAGSNKFSSVAFGQSQNDPDLTPKEKAEVQAFAKLFVKRIMGTRDVHPLIKEFFRPGFASLFSHDYFEKVPPKLYSQLSYREKVRLFVAQQNLCYFSTVDSMSQAHTEEYFKSHAAPFKKLLPKRLADILASSRLVEGVYEFTDRKELIGELEKLEHGIVEARRIFIKKNLEQTAEFRKNLASDEKDEYPIGYRVRVTELEEDLKDTRGILVSKAGQKVFRVETPIFFGLHIVKDHKRLKIVAIEPADGD